MIAAAAAALERARHLGIVLLTGLGDVVHGLPVLNAIRAKYPALRTTWIAEPMPAQLLVPHPSIERVVAWRKKEGWRGVRELREALRDDPADITLDFNVYFKAVIPTMLSGAPVRVGFGRDRARDGIWLAHTHPLPPRRRAHTQDMFMEFLDALGVPRPDPADWKLALTEAESIEREQFFARFDGKPVCAVVPTSAVRAKDWITERWAEVVDALHRDHGFEVVLAGGPGSRETAVGREILERARHKPVWALGDGVRRLLWTLSGCRLVIAPDTGPLHLARALGIPVVGLYGHSNPWRVGPWRAYEDLWVDAYDDPGAPPDPADFTPKNDRMQRITAGDVLERVRLAVERYAVTA